MIWPRVASDLILQPDPVPRLLSHTLPWPSCWPSSDSAPSYPAQPTNLVLFRWCFNEHRFPLIGQLTARFRCDHPAVGTITSHNYLHKLVSWCLTSLFSTNMAISETKGQGWIAIRTQYRKASDILTSTLAAFLFSSRTKGKEIERLI